MYYYGLRVWNKDLLLLFPQGKSPASMSNKYSMLRLKRPNSLEHHCHLVMGPDDTMSYIFFTNYTWHFRIRLISAEKYVPDKDSDRHWTPIHFMLIPFSFPSYCKMLHQNTNNHRLFLLIHLSQLGLSFLWPSCLEGRIRQLARWQTLTILMYHHNLV